MAINALLPCSDRRWWLSTFYSLYIQGHVRHALIAIERQLRFRSTDDVQADYERIQAAGAEFTMPPTDVKYATIAMLDDTCGNRIQLTQLARW